MKTFSDAFTAFLENDALTLALCVKIVRRDLTEHLYTTYHNSITIGTDTYVSNPPITMTTLATTSTSEKTAGFNVTVPYNTDDIVLSDVLAGKFADADVTMVLADYSNAANCNSGVFFKGYVDNWKALDNEVSFDVAPLIKKLDQEVGEIIQATCRNSLGDDICGVDLSDYTTTGTVSGVGSDACMVFACDDSEIGTCIGGNPDTDNFFTMGKVTWNTGDNAGQSMEIPEHNHTGTTHTFYLLTPTRAPISAGDIFTVQAGCDLSWSTCATKFANTSKFNGELYCPGMDVTLQYGV